MTKEDQSKKKGAGTLKINVLISAARLKMASLGTSAKLLCKLCPAHFLLHQPELGPV